MITKAMRIGVFARAALTGILAHPTLGQQATRATHPERSLYPGCVRIFNEENFEGWEADPSTWSITNGAMRGVGGTSRLAYTKADYGSFRLIFTARMNPVNGDHLGVLFWGDRPKDATPRSVAPTLRWRDIETTTPNLSSGLSEPQGRPKQAEAAKHAAFGLRPAAVRISDLSLAVSDALLRSLAPLHNADPGGVVDFRFSPPEWQIDGTQVD